ncbi:hypothetical protein COV49_02550 [Candidatus Falkowbacteria bacterium CG11_big_fil_rev_8_21_14_0_20_39_10]|uniref:Response regulatory domain-containing protein n=1 Tax=Candidatus Falkowbacteria bacterium CG11_big_fil_rev_8_21_14_0_20_39_10 TaxID=1974570 RepID=A0A2M6K930_9BACT|nr:MAG: hypothetical protein COV49_02550 [Candidatus Falkowbacteria bacterium CG11_big_fil_rev_8_21_14_0_20_39_10]
MKKVLIIEDEEHLSEMYKMKFEQEGYSAITANDGLAGVETAKKVKPNLILVDLVMPKMDGYQVLKKIRADKDIKDTMVYILSNLSQDKEITNGFQRGADGYLIKANLTPAQLVKKVDGIFAGEKVGLKKPTAGLPKESGQEIENKVEFLGPRPRILVIDDEEAITGMYKLRLEQTGYEVEVAGNGAWGLKLACQGGFNLIVMDMVMPVMDGYEMLRQIKLCDKCKNTPIIVLSNSAQDNDIVEAKKLGADLYLLKSRITPTKLVKEVKNMLKLK